MLRRRRRTRHVHLLLRHTRRCYRAHLHWLSIRPPKLVPALAASGTVWLRSVRLASRQTLQLLWLRLRCTKIVPLTRESHRWLWWAWHVSHRRLMMRERFWRLRDRATMELVAEWRCKCSWHSCLRRLGRMEVWSVGRGGLVVVRVGEDVILVEILVKGACEAIRSGSWTAEKLWIDAAAVGTVVDVLVESCDVLVARSIKVCDETETVALWRTICNGLLPIVFKRRRFLERRRDHIASHSLMFSKVCVTIRVFDEALQCRTKAA